MDSREFSQWIAWSRWFSPLEDSWDQTGMVIWAALAPHMKNPPEPGQFIPVENNAPKHPTQIRATLQRMAADLGKQ